MDLDITEVVRRARVPASTLRYYEERGLIRSVGRRGLHRVFAEDVLERLALIALGRTAGFSLAEIARMFAPDGRPRIDRRALATRADALDRTIRRMAALAEMLRHVAACPAPSHMECPTFRRMVRAAQGRPGGPAPSRMRRSAPTSAAAATRAARSGGVKDGWAR